MRRLLFWLSVMCSFDTLCEVYGGLYLEKMLCMPAGLKHTSQVRSGHRLQVRSGNRSGQVRLQVKSQVRPGQVAGQVRSGQ